MTEKSTRRTFLQTSAAAAAAAAWAMPTQSAKAQGAKDPSANDTLVVGIMGVNARGSALARGFADQKGCEIAYVCDVDDRAQAKASALVADRQGRKPKVVKDFRKILDDQSVDVLVVAAPDHWHAPATIMGCKAGKHIYVEKPCSHNPREGELAIEASQKYKRVVNMGNQRRSWPMLRDAVKRVQAGDIGEVHYSRGWYNNRRGTIGNGKKVATPDWLDFDLWQGPAPRADFRDNLVHYNWHWFWDWGTGEIGNNGIHCLDICRWGLGADYPTKVVSAGQKLLHVDDDQQTPDSHVVVYHFADNKMITLECLSWHARGREDSQFGISFHGTAGSLVIGSGGSYSIYDERNKLLEEKTGPRDDADHLENFLTCVRTGGTPNSDIVEAHKSTMLCHLGNIAHRTGGVLDDIDPKTGQIPGNEEAMALWGREYESGWEPTV